MYHTELIVVRPGVVQVKHLDNLQARERQRSVVTALRMELRDLDLQDVLALFQ